MTPNDSISRDLGRHESDIASMKEDSRDTKQDIKEIKTDVAEIKAYMLERKTERRLGWLLLTAVGGLGGFLGQAFPFIADFFKAKGLN